MSGNIMENFETKLFEAAKTGSVSLLRKLLKEDSLILDRVEVDYFSETPLHVAAILGHTDFVKEIVSIKPELTNELNLNQSSPLHLASAKGHIDVARAILTVDSRTCLVRDKKGLTPLHLAAIKGRVEVMKMLLHAKPDAAHVMAYRGESILHLCVKHCQLEALKLLVNAVGDLEFVNSKDSDGNTVLHLAVADKQVEIINFLLTMTALEVNASNHNGMTAVDVLIQSRRDVRDSEIEESLKRVGAFVTLEGNIPVHINQNMEKNSWIKQRDEWFDKQRSALMVVASLIATMTFQLAVTPPGGIWQDDNSVNPQADPPSPEALDGRFVYKLIYISNTLSYVASLSIILLLMSGLPIRQRSFVWILIVITWIAIIANAATYFCSTTFVMPGDEVFGDVYLALLLWLSLMIFLLLAGHMTRLIRRLVKKLTKRY